jgi:hypothetical protein
MLDQDAGAARRAAPAFRWIILGGLLLMLGANLPGQLSYDSVVQLFEGRTGVRASYAPGIMSWLLGRFDRLIPGPGLYVTATATLVYGALAALPGLRPRTSWVAAPVALAAVLTPALLVYQGIVWKDVLFANLAVAGFVCLAHAAQRWRSGKGRIAPLAAALVLLATASLARQNGAIVILFAALALAWTARGGGWRASLAWGAGGLVATLLLTQAIGLLVQPRGSTMTGDTEAGMRIIQRYDILGAVAEDPKLDLKVFRKTDPPLVDLVRGEGVKVYTPERINPMAQSKVVSAAFAPVSSEVIARQWRSILLHDPMDYLGHRAQVFRWMVAPPDLGRCLPLHVGVAGPPDKIAQLELSPGVRPQDQALLGYGALYLATPLFSHVTYAVAALAFGVIFVLRRGPADIVMAALMAGALAFAASFFVISLACDYRYLYFLDLAAMAGALYLAIDPRLRTAPPQEMEPA